MTEQQENNFEQIGISSFFTERLKERYIKDPTDIQRKVIPLFNRGESVFFTSATGTGKTLTYLLPLLEKLIQEKGSRTEIRFVIITPTLELCTQINNELEFLLKDTGLKSSLLIGSVSLDRQIETIRKIKPDIIVGNPNRLLILAKKKIIRFSNVQSLVLDEADRLISDEMLDETEELCDIILRGSKKNKDLIIGACSATINKKCKDKLLLTLSSSGYNNKEFLFIESQSNEILQDKIEHWAIFSEKRKKEQTLRSLLAALNTKKKKSRVKALVFTSRGDDAAVILSRLLYHRVSAAGLFGKIGKKPISGSERKEALDSFRNGSIEALVSTDLAARGLDIPDITHVIALDVPADSEVYIHRCGRTARAGKRGIMVTIGDETQMHLLAAMEKKLKI